MLERVRGLELSGHAQQEILAAVRGDELDADDAYAFGMTLYRQQRLAIGEGDVQETFLYKR